MSQRWRPRGSREHWAVVAAVASLASISAGCGSAPSEPPVEAPPAEVNVVSPESADQEVESSMPLVERAEAGPPEAPNATMSDPSMPHPAEGNAVPRAATEAELPDVPQLRLYLARHKIYDAWYPQVGEIELTPEETVHVGTTLPAGAKTQAREVCEAVVESGLVERVRVEYGTESSLGCG